MPQQGSTIEVTDNGGRRRIRDRRFLVSSPIVRERRTNWERRSGFDRRLRRMVGDPDKRRSDEE
jgi:hypothetical protein